MQLINIADDIHEHNMINEKYLSIMLWKCDT